MLPTNRVRRIGRDDPAFAVDDECLVLHVQRATGEQLIEFVQGDIRRGDADKMPAGENRHGERQYR